MSLIPTGNLTTFTPMYPEFGNGIYVGLNPGSSNLPPGSRGFGGGDSVATQSGLTIQTDGNTGAFISTMSAQPQNVLRLTGAFGTSYIQGTNIAFAVPYSGNAGVRILPSTNQINVNNIAFLSSVKVIGASGVGIDYNVNVNQLGSSIRGYGWANTF